MKNHYSHQNSNLYGCIDKAGYEPWYRVRLEEQHISEGIVRKPPKVG